jgi:hypothetical protein
MVVDDFTQQKLAIKVRLVNAVVVCKVHVWTCLWWWMTSSSNSSPSRCECVICCLFLWVLGLHQLYVICV